MFSLIGKIIIIFSLFIFKKRVRAYKHSRIYCVTIKRRASLIGEINGVKLKFVERG